MEAAGEIASLTPLDTNIAHRTCSKAGIHKTLGPSGPSHGPTPGSMDLRHGPTSESVDLRQAMGPESPLTCLPIVRARTSTPRPRILVLFSGTGWIR